MQNLKRCDFQNSLRRICRGARAAICSMLIACALAVFASAQDPFEVAPQAYKLQLENEWVRVVRVHYAPLEKIPAHDHPKGQTIFVYLNDGGPVLFQHVEGVSGNYPATRPPTKAGAYRLAGVQPENHIVENKADVPSDFLQVELKTEAVEPKTFRGRFFPDLLAKQKGNYRKVEFENPQVRITRLICAARGKCEALELASYPALLIALSPFNLETIGDKGKSSRLKLDLGQSKWLEPGAIWQWQNQGGDQAEQLLIEFKSKPVK